MESDDFQGSEAAKINYKSIAKLLRSQARKNMTKNMEIMRFGRSKKYPKIEGKCAPEGYRKKGAEKRLQKTRRVGNCLGLFWAKDPPRTDFGCFFY